MSGQKTINNTTPAVGAIKIQQSTYGLVLPIVYGRTRITGNLIWYGDFKAVAHTVTTQSGGKGGGAPKQTETSYTYTASVAMGLCEGPILGIRTAWRGKKIYTGSTYSGTTVRGEESRTYGGFALTMAHVTGWVNVSVEVQLSNEFEDDFRHRRAATWMSLRQGSDYTCSAGVYTITSPNVGVGDLLRFVYTYVSTDTGLSCLSQIGLDIKNGTPAQSAWSYLTTNHPSQALTYSSIAYVTGANYALGSDASVENHAFEIESSFMFSSTIPDANPAPVVKDALSNPQYGAGFGAEKIVTTDYQDACTAQGIFLSPALTAQQSAASFLEAMAVLTNVGLVWSGGVLKFVPYADTTMTANGVTFTPNTTPIYDLTDDDFQETDSEGPIKVTRAGTGDTFNSVTLEYSDRANAYNVAVMTATDQADIQENNLRQMQTISAPWITEASIAKIVATLILQRSMFIRNKYEFKLGWTKIALEPMDLVTLTDSALGMNKLPVRILSMDEDDGGYLSIVAEDFPKGSASATLYPSTTGSGFAPNFNESPGTILAPTIFEGPSALVTSNGGLEVWVAAGGTDPNYGGCEIWVSLTGSNYKRAASLNGASRFGVTTSSLSSQSVPGATTETVGVTLAAGGQLIAASSAEMAALTTLCYIGGEFVAYEGAGLTGPNAYTIGNHLQRGAYLSGQASHATGVPFVRCDSGVARLPLTPDYIGQTIRVKLLPFNRYGGGMTDLASATEYTYTVTGLQANLAPAAPANLALEGSFTIDTAKFKWDKTPNAATYNVQMWAGSTLAKVREVNVGDALRFDYSAADAVADGGPWRALTVKVQGINANGAIGPLATLAVSNSQVGSLTGATLLAGVNSIAFGCARPADQDFSGIQVWISATSGFTPSSGTLVYDGPNTAITITALNGGSPLVAGTTYYVKAAAYDTFDKVGITIVSAGSAVPIAPGLNTAMVYAYQRAASAPTLKPGDVTVTFASNSITTPSTLANSWLKTIPTVNGNPLYITAVSVSGTGATANALDAAWTTPVMLATDGPGGVGVDGTNGYNAATLTIYQRAASATALTLPSASTTYTFLTGVLTGLNNGWTQGIPVADVTKPFLQASIATAISQAATDAVAASEWSTAQVMTQDAAGTALISDDPYILNAAGAWDLTSAPGVSVNTTTQATSVCTNYFSAPTYAGSTNAVPASKRAFPIDPNRVYNLTANLYAATGNNRSMYILVQFFNQAGSALPHTDSSPDWGGTYSGYVFGGVTTAGQFTRQGGYFGPGTGRNIPAAARTARIGIIMQYSGAGSSSVEQGFQDLRLYDANDAYTALTNAATAQAAAVAAQTDATASLASLTAIFSDSVMSRDEKTEVVRKITQINSEYAGLLAQATALSVSTTAYTTATTNANSYLAALSPAYNDFTQNTTIVRADADAAFNNYYNAKVALTNAIAAKTSTMATDVTLSPLGVLAGGGTSGQIVALATVDLGNGTFFGARNRDDPPGDYPVGTSKQFKQASTFGISSADSYLTLETIKQYLNSTGGGIYQYAYVQLLTYRRWCSNPAATSSASWGAWVLDLDRTSYTGDLNATVGATAGTNLKDSSGTVMDDARVSNGYTENGIGHVMRPLGGNATSGTGTVGALQILLPSAIFYSNTMIRIRIEIYEYQTGRSCSYIVNGYNYTGGPQWLNCTAEYNGPVAGRKRVRFGHNTAGTRNSIWIGSVAADGTASTWEYPRVIISEVITSYTNYDWSTWASGWALSFVTSLGGTSIAEIATPGIGGAMASIDGITTGNATTFIATGAITDTLIGGNLYSTNWSGTTGVGATGWALDRTGNLYANAVQLRGSVKGGSFAAWAWPAAGLTGFYLGAEGLLLGNYNDGKYFEVTSTGDIYAPGFNIISGVATFAGALSGATGSFTGSLSAATGTFAGSLSAATGSFGGSLSAVTGTFGGVTIASGGSISSGQTAYNTGTGWHLSLTSGVPRFSIGNPTGNRLLFDGTNMEFVGAVQLPAFSVAITGTLDTSKSNSLIAGTSIGTLTATPTGGRGTLSYSWVALSGETNPTNRTGLVYLTAPTNNVTGVSAKISNADSSIIGTYIVYVTDQDQRTATARVTSMVAFGTPP